MSSFLLPEDSNLTVINSTSFLTQQLFDVQSLTYKTCNVKSFLFRGEAKLKALLDEYISFINSAPFRYKSEEQKKENKIRKIDEKKAFRDVESVLFDLLEHSLKKNSQITFSRK